MPDVALAVIAPLGGRLLAPDRVSTVPGGSRDRRSWPRGRPSACGAMLHRESTMSAPRHPLSANGADSTQPGASGLLDAAPTSEPTSGGTERLRVVVIDDKPAVRVLVRAMLAHGDAATVVAEADGSPEAVATACAQAPQVVLLDQNLGPTLGTELIGDIMRSCPEAMIAVFSGLDPSTEEASALRAGAFVFYEKSVVTPALAEHLVDDHAVFRRALRGEDVCAPSVIERRRALR